jgi:hypothetical protein
MSKFAGDFSICSAGGDLYPMQATTSNLLFTMSCGTGFDDDSGKPHGCDAVRTFVEPTLKLR